VVISLGNADIPDHERPLIAKAVEKHLYEKTELFDWNYSSHVQKWIDLILRKVDLQGHWQPLGTQTKKEKTVDAVFIEGINHENTAVLGTILVARHVWKQLDFDSCLESLGFNPTQRLAVAVNVINRLVEPVSEHALKGWLRRTAMPEMFGQGVLSLRKDQFYRITDNLFKNRREIERHVRARHRTLFSLKRTLFLYDLTNTFFEGTAEKNPKAQYGKSKHGRDDCPQIVLGMVFDDKGFELAHEVFEGNQKDSGTLMEIVTRLQELVKEEADLFEPVEKPLVILDGGIATKENLKLLREKKFSYLVNETRRSRKEWRQEFSEDKEFKTIQERVNKSPVKVRVLRESQGEDNTDILVLCKSEGRLEKEKAIRSAVEEKFQKAMEVLNKRIQRGKLKDPVKIERAVGRIQSKHPRISRFYNVEYENENRRLTWSRRDKNYQEDEELFGCYVLRTDKLELDGEGLWNLYMTLTRAEEGFRCVKTYLGLRPIRHHTDIRSDAHVFISILAYHLLRNILYTLETNGDTRNWDTIKGILSTHCYTTINVPTKEDGTYRIRKAGIPDETQKAIYKTLGVDWKNLPTKIDRHTKL